MSTEARLDGAPPAVVGVATRLGPANRGGSAGTSSKGATGMRLATDKSHSKAGSQWSRSLLEDPGRTFVCKKESEDTGQHKNVKMSQISHTRRAVGAAVIRTERYGNNFSEPCDSTYPQEHLPHHQCVKPLR